MIIHCPRCGKVMDVDNGEKGHVTLTCRPCNASAVIPCEPLKPGQSEEIAKLKSQIDELRGVCLLTRSVLHGISIYEPYETKLSRELRGVIKLLTQTLDKT